MVVSSKGARRVLNFALINIAAGDNPDFSRLTALVSTRPGHNFMSGSSAPSADFSAHLFSACTT